MILNYMNMQESGFIVTVKTVYEISKAILNF